MHELWNTVVSWLSAHWFDLIIVGVAIFVLKGLFRLPLDDRGRLIKDPKKRPSKYGWLLGTALIFAYFALRIGGVDLDSFRSISAMKLVWSLLIMALYAVLFYVANKKEFTGQGLYLRGLYGSIVWSLGLVGFIFFGFNFWSLGLAVLGFVLRHLYTIPNQRRGVAVWFGKWLVMRDVDDDPDITQSYHRTIWTNRKVCLESGPSLLLVPFDMPGWDIRLIVDELRYLGSEKKPEYTPELNTRPNPAVLDPETGEVVTPADTIGGVIKFQYFGRFRTGQGLPRLRKLPDDIRIHPEDHVNARYIACMRIFAGRHTIAEHLSFKDTPQYREELQKILGYMYRDVAQEFALGEMDFRTLDPEPSDKVRAEVENVAAADQKIIARRKLGQAAGAEIGAQVQAVEERMKTDTGAAAMAALIELERAKNARTIVVDRQLGGGSAAKFFGGGDSKSS